MGLLVNGQWQDKWYDTDKSDGEFEREAAQLRNWVTADGSPGPSGKGGFPAESGRYHLYVSLACPWAHRTLIFRKLKSLEDHISVSVVSPDMLENGWEFDTEKGSTGDHLYDARYLHQIYTRNNSTYTGRVTVPVLWDKQQQCIVSNESSEIIRMFNSAFNNLTGNEDDYYPQALRSEIDKVNEDVYDNINNGVYRTGFATRQEAYEKAYQCLFDALDRVEERLGQQRYLAGSDITEADWRLFTTLIRFDAVYHGHFKCNRRKLEEYEHLPRYVRELYQWPGVAGTVDFSHIKRHYYYSHHMINPTQIVPAGPDIDFNRPHGREAF
ncbi:MAG: glutathione S-transferase family protein [Ketobacteraceae bacterium]|nr:glutathione S-transferase family protein [Ketobacteraceae bacterium]